MKKYLREIEISGIILMAIGFFMTILWNKGYGVWPCVMGIIIWLVSFLFKAFHWSEYERENKQNIFILIGATMILILQMMRRL